MYATIKAIEGGSTTKEDGVDWLKYWIVFAVFCTLEHFTAIILCVIPIFYPIKVSFLLWCMLPRFKGSLIVYDNVIIPILGKSDADGVKLDQSTNTTSSGKKD